MTVPIANLLAHADLAEVRLVAGDSAVMFDRVCGVTVADINAGEQIVAGDLVVLLSDPPPTGWRLDTLLRRVHGLGGAGLLLSSTVPSDPGTHRLTERLGLVLLTGPRPWQLATAAHQLLGAARALTARSVMAAARATRRSDTSVSELLRALAGELSHPVMLLDAGGHVVLDSRPERIGDSPLTTELTERTGPTAVDLPDAGVLVAWPVTTGFGPRLWLAASLAAPLPAEQNAILAALEVATSAVGHRLALVRLADERDARHRIALLGELVDAAADVPADLLRRTVDVGWTMEGWHIAVRIVARSEVDAVARRLNVIGALEAEELTVNVVEQADGWAAWLTLAQEPGPSAVESAGSAVHRAQRRLSTTLPTAVGVGRAHPGPSGVAASLAEASDAARLAGNRPETGRFLHIDRLGLAQLLLAWTRNDTFQPAAAELLGSLAAGGRDLLRTLTVYLDTESSLTETAAILGVHRNTVADRIARVQRELSVDLTDPDTRLALHLACRTLADL